LVPLQGTLNAAGYIKILADHAIPNLRRQGRYSVFQADNAPCHNARVVTDFLNAQRVDRMVFPPCSPDLNPIEAIWGIIKRRRRGRRFTTREELIAWVQEEWDEITAVQIRRLISSMPERVRQVIRNRGGFTRY
jgi:transposase